MVGGGEFYRGMVMSRLLLWSVCECSGFWLVCLVIVPFVEKGKRGLNSRRSFPEKWKL